MKSKMPVIAFLATLLTLLIGVLVLIGWFTQNDFLRSIVPGQVKVKFNVALCFVFSAAVLLLHYFSGRTIFRNRLSVFLSVLVSLIGFLTLIEYTFACNLGIDELFVRDETRSTSVYYAGRMSPILALNLLLIGIGLAFLNKKKTAVYQFIYLVVVAFDSLLMLIGFNLIADIPTYIRVAIHGAICFIILSVAIYGAQPMLQKRITFEVKLLTGFGAIIILILSLSVLSRHYSSKTLITSQSIAISKAIIAEIAQVHSLAVDIERSWEGYVLTGDSNYLESYAAAKNEILTRIENSRELTKNNTIQSSGIDSIEVFVKQQIQITSRGVQIRNEEGKALLLATDPTLRFTTARIENAATGLQQYENKLLISQQNANNNSVSAFNSTFLFFIASVFILLVAILLYILSNFITTRRVKESLAMLNNKLEQKVLETTEEHAATDKLYRNLFENMLHGFVYCKVIFEQEKAIDYICIAVNAAYEELTGLSGALGRKISELIPGIRESYPEIFEVIGRVSLSGKPEQFETYILDRWLSISLYCPEHGYFVGLVDNITDRKNAERKLTESEHRFRSLIENSADAILLMDDNLNTLYQSPAAERMTGISIQERMANPGLRVTHPQDLGIVNEAIEESLQKPGLPVRFQTRLRHPDGHYIWIEGVINNLLHKSGVNAIVLNFRDVSERKESEIQQALFVSIVNSSDDAILSKTLDGNITSWNRGAEKLFGYSADEIVGKNVSIIIPPDRSNEEPEIIEKIKRGEFVDHYETQRVKKNGELIFISLTVSPIMDNQGNVIGASKIARDISERMATEKKLAESEQRFRALIESSSDAIVLNDENSNILYQSPSVERILGYTLHERKGTQVYSYVHPADRDNFLDLYEQMRKRREHPIPFQYRFRHKKGHFIWLEGFVTNLLHYPGVNAIVANYRDVTERKESEEKLAASEQRFRALTENSSDAIVLTDANSIIFYQSPSVTRILGYTLEERRAKPADDNVHPDSREDLRKLSEKLMSTPGFPFAFQYRFRHKMGHFIWLDGIVTNLLEDSSVNAIVANFRDITRRKEAEVALELTLGRFKQAQQIAHLGHWEVDFVTQRASWSDETFNIFGMEPGSMEPSEEFFLSHIHPEDIEMARTTLAEAKQMLKPFSFHHRIVLKNETVRNLFSLGRFEFDLSHKPIRLYGISMDVTELSAKEKMLEQANMDLQTFIYKASHDLRSPIATVLGLVNVAKADLTEERALNYITMIEEVSQKQNKMLLNLTEVMSIRERKLTPASFEIRNILDEVLLSLNGLAKYKKIRFIVDQRVCNPILSDRELMTTIFCQLIENSILYSCELNPEIRIRISAGEGESIVIEVADNGIGMPDEAVEKVFEMFYRATILSRGAGLGLFLVKTAVEKLGGHIKVSSKENEGSTFVVRIPAKLPDTETGSDFAKELTSKLNLN